MAAGLNQRALLDQLGAPGPLSPLQQGLANNSGVRSPTLPNEQAAPLGGGMPQVAVAPGTDRLSVGSHREGPIDPGAMATYQSQMADVNARDKGLGMFDQAGYAAVNRDREAANRQFYGAGYQAPAAMDTGLAPTPVGATAPPAVSAPGADYSGQLEGFNADKLAANKNDPKYRFASIAKGFDVRDPAQRKALSDALAADTSGFFKGGLNGDMISALDPATGQYGNVDVIRGLDAGGQGWQWGAEGPGGGAGTPAGGSPPNVGYGNAGGGNIGAAMAQQGLAQQLQGSPYGNIQNALGKFQQPNLEALLAQLGGR